MLIDAYKTDCVFMTKTKTSDGIGGFVNTWAEGASFKAAIVKDDTLDAIVAEQQGVTEVYSIVVDKGVSLDFHDVIKRKSDGAIFRITSNITDSETPSVASFQIGKVRAERWVLS